MPESVAAELAPTEQVLEEQAPGRVELHDHSEAYLPGEGHKADWDQGNNLEAFVGAVHNQEAVPDEILEGSDNIQTEPAVGADTLDRQEADHTEVVEDPGNAEEVPVEDSQDRQAAGEELRLELEVPAAALCLFVSDLRLLSAPFFYLYRVSS